MVIWKKIISIFLVLFMLCSLAIPVMAWGGVTHYSIVKKLDDRSGLPSYIYTYNQDYINGAIVPDIFVGVEYGVTVPSGWEKLATLMHDNNTFNRFVWQKALTNQLKAYVIGWLTHPISDYYIHGGKPAEISPIYPYNQPYLFYKGIDPRDYSRHVAAEYAIDCINYYEKSGSVPWPWEFRVYSSFIKSSILDFKNRYGGDYPIPSESQINNEFTDLMAVILAEQLSFSYGQYLAAKASFGDYEKWWQAAIEASYNYITRNLRMNAEISSQSVEITLHNEIIAMKKEIGRELIGEGFLIPHGKFDEKTGIYTVRFESKVSKFELEKIYSKKLYEKLEKLRTKVGDQNGKL